MLRCIVGVLFLLTGIGIAHEGVPPHMKEIDPNQDTPEPEQGDPVPLPPEPTPLPYTQPYEIPPDPPKYCGWGPAYNCTPGRDQ